MLKSKKGFTFMEGMVVIILLGICILIWGYTGRDHIKISMMSEAEMFVEKIISQEKLYRADKGIFIPTPGSGTYNSFETLYISTKTNKYFKTFRIIVPKPEETSIVGTVTVELYPDTTKYPDMNGYFVRGIYYSSKDTIEYDEIYGAAS